MSLTKVLFIPDSHIPYQNKRAFKLMLKTMSEFKPDIVVILGDFADFYSVSKFSKDPSRKLSLAWEILEVNKYLDLLDALKPKLKIFIEGNHEYRLTKYIHDKAPELNGILNTSQAFRLSQRGWVYVPYRQDYKLGKVYLTHDIDAINRNAVYKVLDTYMHSAITGHTHKLAYVVEADGLGQPILSAQYGWLGDVSKVDYQHRIKAVKNYVLGFGIGYMDESTKLIFTVPVPIINYKCMINGKIYQG